MANHGRNVKTIERHGLIKYVFQIPRHLHIRGSQRFYMLYTKLIINFLM